MKTEPTIIDLIERKCSAIRMDVEEVLTHCRAVNHMNDLAWQAVLDAELTMQGGLLALRLARNEIEAKTRLQAAE